MSSLEDFRVSLLGIVDKVLTRHPERAYREALAFGIATARASGDSIDKATPILQQRPHLLGLGERILSELADADRNLPPADVTSLEKQVDERLRSETPIDETPANELPHPHNEHNGG